MLAGSAAVEAEGELVEVEVELLRSRRALVVETQPAPAAAEHRESDAQRGGWRGRDLETHITIG